MGGCCSIIVTDCFKISSLEVLKGSTRVSAEGFYAVFKVWGYVGTKALFGCNRFEETSRRSAVFIQGDS